MRDCIMHYAPKAQANPKAFGKLYFLVIVPGVNLMNDFITEFHSMGGELRYITR